MLSVVPNIVFAPNMTQNAERKHRMQNTNTTHFRTRFQIVFSIVHVKKFFFLEVNSHRWKWSYLLRKVQDSQIWSFLLGHIKKVFIVDL